MENHFCRKQMIVFLLIIFIYNGHAYAQTDTTWNHKKCAVVLTYDDGLNIDLTNVIPALDSLGLRGTFYISDYFEGLNAQINGWRKAAAEGHELANHTIWHPCDGSLPGRSFVKPDYDLHTYTVNRMDNEILAMNNILKAIDGKEERTFAFPCGDMKIHDSAYLDYMKEYMPPVNVGLLDGQLAWRQHDGGHTDAPNFKYFIPWANKNLNYEKKSR
jgi:peptidoglycan/xylan/chitin deacetylase (PgdA/CDA1 family)